MDKQNTPNYYAVIPANVRYDKELTSSAKLLYGEVAALSNKEGYCWASNGYFAKLYGKNPAWVSVTFKMLAERGHVRIEIIDRNKRKIWIVGEEVLEKSKGGIRKNQRGVLEKSNRGVSSKSTDSKTEQEKLSPNITSNNIKTNVLSSEKSEDTQEILIGKEVKSPIQKKSSPPSWLTQGITPEQTVANHFPKMYGRFRKKTPSDYNANDLLILFCIEYYKKYKLMYAPSGNGISPFGGRDSSNLKILLRSQSPEIITKVIPYFIRQYEKIESLPRDRPSVSILYGWKNTIIPNCLLGEIPKRSVGERGIRGEITDKEWEEERNDVF